MKSFQKINEADKNALIEALELILEDEWDKAHEIAQQKEGNPAYDRVHALLHRIEGDSFNAGYWYRKVGVKIPDYPTEREAKELLNVLLEED